MKTIKIIDIAKLIAEERYNELPKKIKINNKTYEFDKTDNEYRRFNSGCSFTPLYEFMKNKEIEYFLELIQMEVEVIEEEKEIKKLGKLFILEGNDSSVPTTSQDFNNRDIAIKINELIDVVNEMRKEK